MKPRTIPVTTPIFKLVKEIIHTSSLLRAYPFLAGEVAAFDALVAEWLELVRQEVALMRERSDAQARAVVVDDAFDFLCVAPGRPRSPTPRARRPCSSMAPSSPSA
jgi:hypothetical protein